MLTRPIYVEPWDIYSINHTTNGQMEKPFQFIKNRYTDHTWSYNYSKPFINSCYVHEVLGYQKQAMIIDFKIFIAHIEMKNQKTTDPYKKDISM